MKSEGYVYWGRLNKKEVMELAITLLEDGGGGVFHVVETLASYGPPSEGIPSDLGEGGSIFSSHVELRWTSKDAGMFDILLLSDRKIDRLPQGLKPVPGPWETREETVILIDTNDRSISPQFRGYPRGATKLATRIFYRGGIATFVSPRRFE